MFKNLEKQLTKNPYATFLLVSGKELAQIKEELERDHDGRYMYKGCIVSEKLNTYGIEGKSQRDLSNPHFA